MVNSRNKGARGERMIAAELEDELGIKFYRDLEQVRTAERGDLVCDVPGWEFLIEVKFRAKGNGCNPAWWKQAQAAALAQNLRPVVIYKYDRLPIRVTMNLKDVMECLTRKRWSAENHLVDMPLSGFCYVAREGLAG